MLNNFRLNIFIFFVIIQCVNGLYFHIAETERKCFIEEIPDETMITGKRGQFWWIQIT